MIAEPELKPFVAVPARDEGDRLPALLQSLAEQTWLRPGFRLPVFIVLNNTNDNSINVVRECVRRHPSLDIEAIDVHFEPPHAHVGSARRLALDTAWAHSGHAATAVLLTTDADAQVADDWVEANLEAIRQGADLVGGEIAGDPREEAELGPAFARLAAQHARYAALADRMAALVDPIVHDPMPRHFDHTGASLAVRGTVYEFVGGLPALPFREDLAFVSRVRAAGFRIRHAPNVRVQVSARLVGRAPGGMADCLRIWRREIEELRPHLVEPPQATLRRLQRRHQIRGLMEMDGARRESALLGLGAPDARIETSADVAALLEALAPDEPDAPPTVPVEVAIAEIEQLIRTAEGVRYAA